MGGASILSTSISNSKGDFDLYGHKTSGFHRWKNAIALGFCALTSVYVIVYYALQDSVIFFGTKPFYEYFEHTDYIECVILFYFLHLRVFPSLRGATSSLQMNFVLIGMQLTVGNHAPARIYSPSKFPLD